MHVRVDEAREREQALAVHHLARVGRRNVAADPRELAVGNRHVAFLNRRLARPDDADVLDEQVVLLCGWHGGIPGGFQSADFTPGSSTKVESGIGWPISAERQWMSTVFTPS